ncbi:MAG: Ig-like domain-containing protein [Bacteroidales bacterium]|nr:Ig-like domain-containing protein [Bacteroidales bacterium]MCB8999303.1 Ig-like domain-containing protein [Bacteroidales bacterium]MCB9012441.1 Ig-like domain-containing protein [Bacteroidales bacterium]
MKRLFLLSLMFVTAVTLNAQVFTEYFQDATTGGDVEGYNDWYVSFKSSEANGVSPIVDEETLFYDGYAGSDIGKSALLDSLVGQTSATQRISTKVVTFGSDTLMPMDGSKMYAAFIVSILPYSWNSYRDFFTWEASSGSSFTRGRIFAKVLNDNMDLQLGVSKNSSSEITESEVMVGGVETYHLLVLVYEAIAGDASNDVITLYIDPDPTKAEADQTVKLVSTDVQSDYTSGSSKIKINLRQRGIGAKIGGIRVGTSWESVLQGESTTVNVTGVSLDQSTLELVAGTTGNLVATVAPADATDPSVTWSSDNEAAATVADGVVTAVAAGEATITVTTTDGSFTASCVVTVTPSNVAVRNITVKGYSFYPNPVVDGVLHIKFSDTFKANNIEIYNVLGVMVHRENVDNRTNLDINTSDMLKQGIYFVKFNGINGSHSERFIVK